MAPAGHLIIKIDLELPQRHLAITIPITARRQTGLTMLEARAMVETAVQAHDQPFVPIGYIQPN